MARRRSRTGSSYLVFLIPGLALTAAVVVVPLVMTIGASFTRWQGVGVPAWIGLDNYGRLMHDPSFWASFRNIPQLIEAADVDGATWWQRFTWVTVHLLKPEIYVVLVTTTIAALKIFGQIFVLTRGGPGDATLVPSYFAYKSLFEKAEVGYGSAI